MNKPSLSRVDHPSQRLLLVEDNPGDARLLRELLSEGGANGIEWTHVESLAAAERHLTDGGVDLILLDLGLPDAQGLETLRRAKLAAPRVPVVVLSGLDDESLALEALHQGAGDYLVKGQISARELRRSMRHAVEREGLKEEVLAEKGSSRMAGELFQALVENVPDIIARFSPDLRHLYVSPSVRLVTGRPPEDFVGRTNREMGMPLELVERWDAALLRVLRDGTGRENGVRLCRPGRDAAVRLPARSGARVGDHADLRADGRARRHRPLARARGRAQRPGRGRGAARGDHRAHPQSRPRGRAGDAARPLAAAGAVRSRQRHASRGDVAARRSGGLRR